MRNNFTFITADDHSIVTKSLSLVLEDLYNDAKIYQANNIAQIIKILNSTHVNLLILDISFPDGNSLNIIPTLKKIQPDLRILIFSGMDEEVYGMRYLKAGVNGYLSKLSTEDEIVIAVNKVITTGKYLSKYAQEKIIDDYIFNKPSNPISQLSNRELEIAKLFIEGRGNTEISNILHLQKSTVSTYKNRIFDKLGINSLSDLIRTYNLYESI